MTGGRLARAIVMASAVTLLVACGAEEPSRGDGDGASARNGTAEGAERGGTLNLLGSGDVDYMDANISYYSVGYLALRMWSRQLFTYPADPARATEAVPDLAELMPSASNNGVSTDGKTYTIAIRDGARWNTQPPRQVTAEDVVRGVKRTCNPVQPFGGIPDFADLIVGYQQFCDGFAGVSRDVAAIKEYINTTAIAGVAAKDARTVVFSLSRPATYFIDMLTMPAFSPAPVEVLNYLPASPELARNQVSNGPYQVESYEPTKRLVLTQNAAWNPDTDDVREAFVDRIVVNQAVSEESTQQQLEVGGPSADMQWDNLTPPARIPALLAAGDRNLNLGVTASVSPYVVFNTASPNNKAALADVRVRRALMHGINRDAIIQSLGGPKVNPPLTHVLPPGVLGSRDGHPYPLDRERAKQLLAEAGFPNGLTLKVLYRAAQDASMKTFATLQHSLSEVGVVVEGVPAPTADFVTQYLQVPDVARRGVWDLALSSWAPDWYGNSALSYIKPLFGGQSAFPPLGSNFGLYVSDALASIIDRAASAVDEQVAADAWALADEQIMADAVMFPISSPRQANYHAAHVHNAVYLPALQNFDPTNVWLERDKQGG